MKSPCSKCGKISQLMFNQCYGCRRGTDILTWWYPREFVDHPRVNDLARMFNRRARVIALMRPKYFATGCWKWLVLHNLYAIQRDNLNEIDDREKEIHYAITGALKSGDIVLTEQGKKKYVSTP